MINYDKSNWYIWVDLQRLGIRFSQADVKCLKFRKALGVSSQNILLAKLVQIDLDMNMLKPNNKHELWRDTGLPQEGRYEKK